ncbi:Cytochrome bo(3) ubiquinol oxidase subunit 2 precursor [compost metagenome]
MRRLIKIVIALLIVGVVAVGVTMLLKGINIDVLNPQGEIARKEHQLIVFTLLLSLVVVIPVFVMLIVFSLRYREGNKRAAYRPNWEGNRLLEAIWWGIPCVIIVILGIVTWQSSHELDPYKDLDSSVTPVNVQVVALQWKWLFIYPEQQVATVNELIIPEKTPINFTITSDAPMNSFWIPSLGSQVYAMSGMSTKLRLIADRIGEYRGSSANISGEGFADMNFMAKSRSKTDFDAWVQQTKSLDTGLDEEVYKTLAEPGVQERPLYYSLKDKDLYDKIIMKYMMPPAKNDDNHDAHMDHAHMEGM